MHECRKMKRLKSYRERNQMRGYGRKSSQHHCCRHVSRKDMAHMHSCCHGGCRRSSRSYASSSSVIPISQEPNIITESRLIGHQGLFNHEVKSIDIERLLGEQRKMEKSTAQEKKKATSNPCSASRVPFPLCVVDCTAGDTEKMVLFEDKSDEATKACDEVGDKEKDHVQELAHTLERRPEKGLPDLSSESCESTFFTDRSSRVKDETDKGGNTKHVPSAKDREAQLMSGANNNASDENAKETISPPEQTPGSQGWPGLHSQTDNPSPVKPSSYHSISSSSNHRRRRRRRRAPGCSVSDPVCAAAAGLCSSLKFPFLKKRSLVEESRRVLLDALRERHGAQLQENMLRVRSCLSFDSSVTKASLNQEGSPADHALFTPFIPESPPCFENQEDASLEIRRTGHFSWKSSPQLPHSMKQVETCVSFLDNVFRPARSPELCLNFEPSESVASEHWFAPSPASSWGDKHSATPLRGDGLDVRFDSFDQATAAGESRSSGCRRLSEVPFFLPQPQAQFRHAARPASLLRNRVPFETETCFFASSSGQFQHQQQQSRFQAFPQSAPPLSCFPRLSHPSDMDTYPPSYVLDKGAPPYFPSLEPWSFPPMRLY